MSDSRVFDKWIDLDFEFSSCELRLESDSDGFVLRLNGLEVDANPVDWSLEALFEDAFPAICRGVYEWIGDEVWAFVERAVMEAWGSIEDQVQAEAEAEAGVEVA